MTVRAGGPAAAVAGLRGGPGAPSERALGDRVAVGVEFDELGPFEDRRLAPLGVVGVILDLAGEGDLVACSPAEQGVPGAVGRDPVAVGREDRDPGARAVRSLVRVVEDDLAGDRDLLADRADEPAGLPSLGVSLALRLPLSDEADVAIVGEGESGEDSGVAGTGLDRVAVESDAGRPEEVGAGVLGEPGGDRCGLRPAPIHIGVGGELGGEFLLELRAGAVDAEHRDQILRRVGLAGAGEPEDPGDLGGESDELDRVEGGLHRVEVVVVADRLDEVGEDQDGSGVDSEVLQDAAGADGDHAAVVVREDDRVIPGALRAAVVTERATGPEFLRDGRSVILAVVTGEPCDERLGWRDRPVEDSDAGPAVGLRLEPVDGDRLPGGEGRAVVGRDPDLVLGGDRVVDVHDGAELQGRSGDTHLREALRERLQLAGNALAVGGGNFLDCRGHRLERDGGGALCHEVSVPGCGTVSDGRNRQDFVWRVLRLHSAARRWFGCQ